MATQSPKRPAKVDASHALRLREIMASATASDEPSPVVSHPRKSPPPQNLTGAHTKITAITPQENGHAMQVSLCVYLSSDDDIVFQEQQSYELTILTASYQKLALTCGHISSEQLDALTQAERLYAAVCQCIIYLGYGSMSCKALCQKLLRKGYDKNTADEAIDYMIERGYLDEVDTALRLAERGIQKYWGSRRIQSDLFAKGFSAHAIDTVMASLEEIDFVPACIHVIQAKYRGELPKDPATRRKLVAALMRQGYSSDTIKQAIHHMK